MSQPFFDQTSHGPASVLCKPSVRKYCTEHPESTEKCDNSLEKKKDAEKKLSTVAYTDHGMHIFMNIKGFTKDDVNIQVEGTMLKIVVNKITLIPGKKAKDQKTLYRRYLVPLNLNLYKITAEINDDILKITVPSIKGEIEWKEP